MTTLRNSFTALVLALLLVACATASSDTTSTVGPIPSTSAPIEEPSSTIRETTTSTDAVTTSTTGDSVLDEASGSGCTPGAGDLPDGEWFGYLLLYGETQLEFDLACWFTGDAAVRASAEDGEESPPPNDYYIRNENEATRTLTISPDVLVVWYPDFGDPNTETETTYQAWVEGIEERGLLLGIWLEVSDGEVALIREQWVP